MRAKCPYCQCGCERCKDGFIEVAFAEGEFYTRHCKSCDRRNGGRIVGGTSPLTLDDIKEPPPPCVFCGSKDMEWEKV